MAEATHRLEQLKVDEVSLVDVGANQQEFIVTKSDKSGKRADVVWPRDMNSLINKADGAPAEPPVAKVEEPGKAPEGEAEKADDAGVKAAEGGEAGGDVTKTTLLDESEGLIGEIGAACKLLGEDNTPEIATALLAKIDARRAALAKLAGIEEAPPEDAMAKARAALTVKPTAEDLAKWRTDKAEKGVTPAAKADVAPPAKTDTTVAKANAAPPAAADDMTSINKAMTAQFDAMAASQTQAIEKLGQGLRAGLLESMGTLSERVGRIESNVSAFGRSEGIPSSRPDDGDGSTSSRKATTWPRDMNDHPSLKG